MANTQTGAAPQRDKSQLEQLREMYPAAFDLLTKTFDIPAQEAELGSFVTVRARQLAERSAFSVVNIIGVPPSRPYQNDGLPGMLDAGTFIAGGLWFDVTAKDTAQERSNQMCREDQSKRGWRTQVVAASEQLAFLERAGSGDLERGVRELVEDLKSFSTKCRMRTFAQRVGDVRLLSTNPVTAEEAAGITLSGCMQRGQAALAWCETEQGRLMHGLPTLSDRAKSFFSGSELTGKPLVEFEASSLVIGCDGLETCPHPEKSRQSLLLDGMLIGAGIVAILNGAPWRPHGVRAQFELKVVSPSQASGVAATPDGRPVLSWRYFVRDEI